MAGTAAQLADHGHLSLLTIPLELTLQIVELTAERFVGRGDTDHVTGDEGTLDDLGAVINLSLTSKTMAEVCIRTFYMRVMLRSPSAACNFLLALRRRSHIAEHVRKLSIRSAQSDQPYDIAEAEKAANAEPRKARRLLRAGTVDVPTFIAMSILHRLPRLTMLGASDTVLRKLRQGFKIAGSSLVALEVTARRHLGPCHGPYDWMNCFRPGQLPRNLHNLTFSHLCDGQCQAGIPPEDWAAIGASVVTLALVNVPASSTALTRMLQHCRRLETLDVAYSELSTEAVCRGISACQTLESSLFSVSISPLHYAQTALADGNRFLSSFSRFAKLGSLSVPMAAKMPETAPSIRLPPKLIRLTLSWTAASFSSYWLSPFPAFISDAIRSGQMPKTLRVIVFNWDSLLFCEALSGIDLVYFERALPLFEATCKSKGIRFLHSASSNGPSVTSEEVIAMLRKAAK